MTDEELAHLNGKQVFARDASPCAWLDVSDELRDAAELLWVHRSPDLHVSATDVLDQQKGVFQVIAKHAPLPRACVLLSGLSIENALKGLLVTREPALVTTGALPRSLSSHKLTSLAAKIPDLILEPVENTLLDTLEEALTYWSRYPIPKSWVDLTETFEQDFGDGYWEAFVNLQYRLCRLIYSETRNGWSTGNGVSTQFTIAKYEHS